MYYMQTLQVESFSYPGWLCGGDEGEEDEDDHPAA